MNAKRVLFVDDDAALGKMFADFLSGSGYQARTTATGAEALRQLVEFQPHLVVLDIGLPDISGLEILRQLKANPLTRNVLVILITGASGLEMKIEGYQTGANDYLSKPINLRELRLKIERCFLNLKDQDTAVAFKHKEMLKSIVNTLGQGLYRGWDELRRVPAGSPVGITSDCVVYRWRSQFLGGEFQRFSRLCGPGRHSLIGFSCCGRRHYQYPQYFRTHADPWDAR